MRKCVRCQLASYSVRRTHCLYCDAPLEDIPLEEIMGLKSEVSTQERIVKAPGVIDHQRMQYLVSTFFHVRSLSFVYVFSRNQLKVGQRFIRFFIQPFDFSYFFRIPWIFVNLVDSVFFHMMYRGFCQQCGWKHKKMTTQGQHSLKECEYNKEYATIVNQILSGQILRVEDEFKEQALEKAKKGERSAYNDLCSRKKNFESFLDIMIILLSLGFWIFLVILVAMPILGAIYGFDMFGE